MRFTSIEQYFTAIRQWLTEKLKGYSAIANPALNGYVRDCTKLLARSMGRSRVESHLPSTMSVEFVKEVKVVAFCRRDWDIFLLLLLLLLAHLL